MVPLGLGVGPTGLRVLTRQKGFECMQHESDIQATCAYCHVYFSFKKKENLHTVSTQRNVLIANNADQWTRAPHARSRRVPYSAAR